MNPDTLLQLLIRADEDSLRKLSSYPEMWEHIRPLLSSQRFWYLRVQHLVGDRELAFREESNLAWKTTYFELEKYIGKSRVLKSAIEGDSSVLSIQVLLELGFDPLENDSEAIASSISRERTDILKVLLAHPKVDEETFKLIDSLLVHERGTISLPVVNTLLADDRFIQALSPERKKQLYDSLTHTPTTLRDSIRDDLIEIVRLYLEFKELEQYTNIVYLYQAIELGHIEIVRLLLEDGRLFPSDREEARLLLYTLSKQSVEMLRLFQADGRLDIHSDNIVINIAILEGNVDVIRELLPSYSVDSLIDIVSSSISREQMSILKLLLSDQRLNVMGLKYTPSLIDALEPLISRRLVGAYLADPKPVASRTESFYSTSFLCTIIVKNLDPSAALDWLIEQRDLDAAIAARSVVSNEKVQGKFQEAYRGYFLCVLHHLDLDETLEIMKRERCSEGGIRLAARLIGAQLGTERQVTHSEYRDAFKDILM